MNRALLPGVVANLRDAGGLPAGPRHVVRSRRLLRSAALAHLPPAAAAALTTLLGPAVYLDLRTEEEVDRDGAPDALVAAGWRWLRLPVRDRWPGAPPEPPARYRAALPGYVAAADQVAAALLGEPRPAVLCCSLGKDRTGMVAALLLARLCVAPADIGADFEDSNASLAVQRHLLPPRWRDPASEIEPVRADQCLATLAEAGPVPARDAALLRAELLTASRVMRPVDEGEDEIR